MFVVPDFNFYLLRLRVRNAFRSASPANR